MFCNPLASPLDKPFYEPTTDRNIHDVELFWVYIEYNNNLFYLKNV